MLTRENTGFVIENPAAFTTDTDPRWWMNFTEDTIDPGIKVPEVICRKLQFMLLLYCEKDGTSVRKLPEIYEYLYGEPLTPENESISPELLMKLCQRMNSDRIFFHPPLSSVCVSQVKAFGNPLTMHEFMFCANSIVDNCIMPLLKKFGDKSILSGSPATDCAVTVGNDRNDADGDNHLLPDLSDMLFDDFFPNENFIDDQNLENDSVGSPQLSTEIVLDLGNKRLVGVQPEPLVVEKNSCESAIDSTVFLVANKHTLSIPNGNTEQRQPLHESTPCRKSSLGKSSQYWKKLKSSTRIFSPGSSPESCSSVDDGLNNAMIIDDTDSLPSELCRSSSHAQAISVKHRSRQPQYSASKRLKRCDSGSTASQSQQSYCDEYLKKFSLAPRSIGRIRPIKETDEEKQLCGFLKNLEWSFCFSSGRSKSTFFARPPRSIHVFMWRGDEWITVHNLRLPVETLVLGEIFGDDTECPILNIIDVVRFDGYKLDNCGDFRKRRHMLIKCFNNCNTTTCGYSIICLKHFDFEDFPRYLDRGNMDAGVISYVPLDSEILTQSHETLTIPVKAVVMFSKSKGEHCRLSLLRSACWEWHPTCDFKTAFDIFFRKSLSTERLSKFLIKNGRNK